ncbi:hypothetical protein JCM10207_008783 [Rhodosporidiobolus poonsookiae]
MASSNSEQEQPATRPPQELIVLAGVVGSGKSTLSSRWAELVPNWVRVNQDDLGDRRACEAAVRTALREGQNVLVDRQNFDAGQRRTWLEIASEFAGVKVGGMVMGTRYEDCRERLLVREDHPTIDNPALAVQLLDKFSGLWSAPQLDEGFDNLLTLPALPPASAIDAALIASLLTALRASPSNPSAAQQRQPRPRERELYRRPDGFVDDGTWRAPPVAWRAQGQGWAQPQQGAYGAYGQPQQGGWGYRPPAPAHAYPGGGGWQAPSRYDYGQGHPQQQPQGWGGYGGWSAGGAGAGAGRGRGGPGSGQAYQWGQGGQRLGDGEGRPPAPY